MLSLSDSLLYYKRHDIQEQMVAAAENKEVAIKFGKKGFGKRPDMLSYPNDVLALAKNGATSFHVSEEIWDNPLSLSKGMRKEELNGLRKGWDLVIDIDSSFWHLSKLTAYLFIKAFRNHGVRSVSCKFSGNKGFHIGVPFEAFPEQVNEVAFHTWFPEGPRRIAEYLLDYILRNFIKVDGQFAYFDRYRIRLSSIRKKVGDNAFKSVCSGCGKTMELTAGLHMDFLCARCDKKSKSQKPYLVCDKCGILMKKLPLEKKPCSCGSSSVDEVLDPVSIMEVDTLLIAQRHLYRMPYSLHEKSGLVSLPLNPDKVMEFKKEQALPQHVKPLLSFLDRSKILKKEGEPLVLQAFDHEPKLKQHKKAEKFYDELLDGAVPRELFPPCIKKILEGLEDGRKRALFAMTNFLRVSGWNHNEIEELFKEWNKKNKESLREVDIKGHLRYHKQRHKRIPPPNCRSFYQDMGVCFPDNLCERIKNPASYSRIKGKALQKRKPKKRKRLSEKQKAMRRAYRKKMRLKNEQGKA